MLGRWVFSDVSNEHRPHLQGFKIHGNEPLNLEGKGIMSLSNIWSQLPGDQRHILRIDAYNPV